MDVHSDDPISLGAEVATGFTPAERSTSSNTSNVIPFPPRFWRVRPGETDEEFERLSSFDLANVRDWLYFCSTRSEALADMLDLALVMNPKDWLCLLGEYWNGFKKIGVLNVPLYTAVTRAAGDAHGTIPEMMSDWERAGFDQLPDIVTIYRGCGPINKSGCSWTFDRWVAERVPLLPEYRTDEPLLLTASISKERVAALKFGRAGRELIVFGLMDDEWMEESLSQAE